MIGGTGILEEIRNKNYFLKIIILLIYEHLWDWMINYNWPILDLCLWNNCFKGRTTIDNVQIGQTLTMPLIFVVEKSIMPWERRAENDNKKIIFISEKNAKFGVGESENILKHNFIFFSHS